MSGKSRIKQNPRMLYVVQDITNASGSTEPETLNMIFDSEEAAELYIKVFGKPGWRVQMMCRAISVGDIQLMLRGECNVIGREQKVDTSFVKRLRDNLFSGARYTEHMWMGD